MERVQQIVEKILEENGLELVEFNLRHQRNRSSVKILVDTPRGNVNLDQIAEATRKINDSEEFYAELPEDFRLEVSSPGLNYPLKTAKDFSRHLNKTIRLKYKEEGTTQTLTGDLAEVTGNNITLAGKFGQKTIGFDNIVSGKIEIKFK
ncbi:MAG: ribosome maturation factor RimP [Fidelibacterota bacterium]